MAKSASVVEMLDRAVAIGAEIERIMGDRGLQRLSREAWVQQCLALGGYGSVEELEAARERLTSLPYLDREVRLRGETWWRQGQDRPAPWPGFADGDGPRAAQYAERIVAHFSIEQCSAIAAYCCAEMRPDDTFGRLSSFEERDAMLAPLTAELAQLDKALAAEARISDLLWRGDVAFVAPGRGVAMIQLTPELVGRIASAAAEQTRDWLRQGARLGA